MTPLLANENPVHARRGRAGWGRKSRPIAAFLLVVARHGAAMARHGRHGAWGAPSRCPRTVRTSNRPFGFSRNTKHGFFSRGCARDTQSEPPPGPPRTPPGRCFSARCGAAWGGYGAAWAAAVPRTGTQPVGFSPAKGHASWLSPVPPAASRRATSSPTNGFSRITRHETRITAFMLSCPRFSGISRYFQVKNIAHGSLSAHRKSFLVGFTTSAFRCRSRRPPGSFLCGERQTNPC